MGQQHGWLPPLTASVIQTLATYRITMTTMRTTRSSFEKEKKKGVVY